ncbi:MAG: GWxTD domain-containing protein, partial [Rhodothermales bacterium]|nr:GWxTD domain-containing protein [Rhodothermales bacterium]
ASAEATQAFAPVVVRDTLAAGPGRTQIEVTLTDLGTRRQTRRRLAVDVPVFDGTRAVLGPVRLAAAHGGGGFVARPGPDLTAGHDSLRATAELFDGHRMGAGRIVWRLLRIPADTAVAAAPYLLRAPARLVRYDAPETLLVRHHRVDPSARRQEVSVSLPALPRGVYRVEAEAGLEAGHRLRGQRDVAVRSAGFPRIIRLEEMIEALAYLARPREHARLMEAAAAEEQRRRFDAFWGRLVPDRQQAASLLQRYYERVEEANLRFTTYKEGWRTDRGMVYIILGEPLLIDDRLDREVWHYSYDDRDALSTFVFHRRPLVGSGGRYHAYLLERQFFHEAAWRRAVDRWRRGDVL